MKYGQSNEGLAISDRLRFQIPVASYVPKAQEILERYMRENSPGTEVIVDGTSITLRGSRKFNFNDWNQLLEAVRNATSRNVKVSLLDRELTSDEPKKDFDKWKQIVRTVEAKPEDLENHLVDARPKPTRGNGDKKKAPQTSTTPKTQPLTINTLAPLPATPHFENGHRQSAIAIDEPKRDTPLEELVPARSIPRSFSYQDALFDHMRALSQAISKIEEKTNHETFFSSYKAQLSPLGLKADTPEDLNNLRERMKESEEFLAQTYLSLHPKEKQILFDAEAKAINVKRRIEKTLVGTQTNKERKKFISSITLEKERIRDSVAQVQKNTENYSSQVQSVLAEIERSEEERKKAEKEAREILPPEFPVAIFVDRLIGVPRALVEVYTPSKIGQHNSSNSILNALQSDVKFIALVGEEGAKMRSNQGLDYMSFGVAEENVEEVVGHAREVITTASDSIQHLFPHLHIYSSDIAVSGKRAGRRQKTVLEEEVRRGENIDHLTNDIGEPGDSSTTQIISGNFEESDLQSPDRRTTKKRTRERRERTLKILEENGDQEGTNIEEILKISGDLYKGRTKQALWQDLAFLRNEGQVMMIGKNSSAKWQVRKTGLTQENHAPIKNVKDAKTQRAIQLYEKIKEQDTAKGFSFKEIQNIASPLYEGLSRSSLQRDISELKEKGLFHKEGKSRGTRWHIGFEKENLEEKTGERFEREESTVLGPPNSTEAYLSSSVRANPSEREPRITQLHQILKEQGLEKEYNIQEIKKITEALYAGLSHYPLGSDLRTLHQEGLLTKKGERRWTKWIVTSTETPLEVFEQPTLEERVESDESNSQKTPNKRSQRSQERREYILQVLAEQAEGMNRDEILERIHETYPTISYQSMYQELVLLREEGRVENKGKRSSSKWIFVQYEKKKENSIPRPVISDNCEERRNTLLELLKAQDHPEGLSRKEILEIAGIPNETYYMMKMQKDLVALRKQGYLRMEGARAIAKWYVVDSIPEPSLGQV